MQRDSDGTGGVTRSFVTSPTFDSPDVEDDDHVLINQSINQSYDATRSKDSSGR